MFTMPRNRRLATDLDFKEAMEHNVRIRVFQDDLMIDSGSVVIRFDNDTVVTQGEGCPSGGFPPSYGTALLFALLVPTYSVGE
jgi:hypothetical protein